MMLINYLHSISLNLACKNWIFTTFITLEYSSPNKSHLFLQKIGKQLWLECFWKWLNCFNDLPPHFSINSKCFRIWSFWLKYYINDQVVYCFGFEFYRKRKNRAHNFIIANYWPNVSIRLKRFIKIYAHFIFELQNLNHISFVSQLNYQSGSFYFNRMQHSILSVYFLLNFFRITE